MILHKTRVPTDLKTQNHFPFNPTRPILQVSALFKIRGPDPLMQTSDPLPNPNRSN